MINTIFYFPESLTFEEYRNLFDSGQIYKNTIVFAKAQKSIYMGGDNYSHQEVAPVVEHVNVYIGSGQTYETTNFSDTGSYLVDNMEVSINKGEGDYIFIKVGKDDIVRNLYTHTPGIEGFDYTVTLEDAVVDGNYKYYKSSFGMRDGQTTYIINKNN